MIWRVLPFRSGNFQHILIQIPTPGISSTIFTQRLSADNLPSKGSSKSDGGLGASSAFRYTSANGDARVLSHYTCFSCTLTTFLVGKSLHCLLFSLIQQALCNKISNSSIDLKCRSAIYSLAECHTNSIKL